MEKGGSKQMDILAFLQEACALPGVPGYEDAVAEVFTRYVRPFADDIRRDALGSVIARVGGFGPRVLVCAHMDEIGMVVSAIEDDGCLRLVPTGGVDPRILPAHDVIVLTREGPIPGLVGAVPPHLTSPADREKAVKWENLFVDTGMDAEAVRGKVRVGDMCVLRSPVQALANGHISGKTLDDRAGLAALLVLAEELSRMRVPAQVLLCATVQEEVGMRGAGTAAFGTDPDFGIAVDVTHGEGPGTDRFEAFPLDRPAIGVGTNLHPGLSRRLQETARRVGVPFSVEVIPMGTGTDAGAIQQEREGIPTALVSIPLRYMHTSVETLQEKAIAETGRLLAAGIDDIARDWGDWKWY